MASADALCFLVFFPNVDCVPSVFSAVKGLDRRSLDDGRLAVPEGISSMFRIAETGSIRLRLPADGLSESTVSRRSSSSASARDISQPSV